MNFFVGLHQPSDAQHFERCMVSVNRLRDRKSDFPVREWMLDSGAFTELKDYGRYRESPEEYAKHIRRWYRCGKMVAAVSQDYMCEPLVINGGSVGGMRFVGTGLNVSEHQRLTIERYDALMGLLERPWPFATPYLMPVLQGYWPEEYLQHLEDYGGRLHQGQWVGVGSVCKRNSDVEEIEAVLMAIHKERPDLLLHGFGVKLTALESSVVRECLHSADSMAWSQSARLQGRNGNSWKEARHFVEKIEGQKVRGRQFQTRLF